MNESKTETEKLMNTILPLAEQALSKYGEFAPVGVALDSQGKIVMVLAGDSEGPDAPSAVDLIDVIKRGFIEGARTGNYKATALAYDSTVMMPDQSGKVDAIAVALDHRDGYTSIAYFPYTLQGENVSVDDDAAFAVLGGGEIFSR